MSKLISFEIISGKLNAGEFVSFHPSQQLQQLAGPGNVVLTFVDRQGQQFHTIAKYDSHLNQIFPPILYNLLVCWAEEEFTLYYLVPQEARTERLIYDLDILSQNSTNNIELLEMVKDILTPYRLLREGREHWFPSTLNTLIDKVYFIQGWF